MIIYPRNYNIMLFIAKEKVNENTLYNKISNTDFFSFMPKAFYQYDIRFVLA